MKTVSVPLVGLLLAATFWPAWAAGQSERQSLSLPTQVDAAAPIAFGQATVQLDGPWKFRTGDSPLDPVTKTPLWAETDFDDSHWETVDLTPKAGDTDFLGLPACPGWSLRGHAGYLGWAWYRLRVPVLSDTRQRFAVAELTAVDDAYQFFGNGKLLGGLGRFNESNKPPVVFPFQRAMFPFPQVEGGDNHSQVITYTLAFRVWRGPFGRMRFGSEGGMRGGPVFGRIDAVASQANLNRFRIWHQFAYFPFEMLLLFLLAILAAGQTLFDPSDPVYFWVAAVLFVAGLYDVTMLLSVARILDGGYIKIDDALLDPLLLGGWAFVWWIWFRLRRPAWVPWAIGALTLTHCAVSLLEDNSMYMGAALLPFGRFFQGISITVRLLCLALLFFIVALGIRKDGREGWMILPAAVLLAPQQFTGALMNMNVRVVWTPFGVIIFIGQVANLFLAGGIAILMLRRLWLSVRRQRQMAFDVKQAHEVQQVLIPEAIPEISGFNIQSVYLPAGEVGGDFFQIVETPQGGVLLCIGDVSGKGLPAAMTVSLLVGTFRTLVRYTQSPGAILDAMNTRMLGRSRGGFTTCLVLRIDSDGTLTVANAGHIAPYVRGTERQVENGFPLGLVATAEYPEVNLRLDVQEQLTLVTDGVVEARSPSGELLGFDRTAAMATNSAKTIANCAKEFGQEDDITVLAIIRTSGGEESIRHFEVPAGLPEPA